LRNTWSYGLAKIKFNYIKIKKELELEQHLSVGKILLNKEYIFTLQNNSIIIYDKKNFNKITDI
jgi:hypothetical protein